MASRNSDKQEKRMLLVGLICLDIVSTCDKYPQEDEDKRALHQYRQRGGNAANQSDMLAQLGMKVEYFGCLCDGYGVDFARDSLQKRGVVTENCVIHKDMGFPTSLVTLSLATGSRTILSYRPPDFPEVSSEDFKKLNLQVYHWIHFEGRRNNLKEIHKMIDIVDEFNSSRKPSDKIRISIELEKRHENSASLLHRGDIITISRDIAEYLGYDTSSAAVMGLYSKVKPGSILVCPWGSLGADGMDSQKMLLHSPAFPPDKMKDTLGAGDTFIAGLFKSLYDGCQLEEALKLGCKLAGYKCGIVGYDGLKKAWNEMRSRIHISGS